MRHRRAWRWTLRSTLAAGLITGAAASAAWAHHGWSGYDSGNGQTLEGTIVEASYENPHGTIRLETQGKIWLVILAPPYRMQNRGLSADMLRPGATAAVTGYPHKTVEDELRAERITVGGATTELR